MSAEETTEEFDFDRQDSKIEIGDLVKDTIIISETPADRYIGIVVNVEFEGYEKHFQPINLSNTTAPIKNLRKPDKCTVYWFHGDRAGQTEIVPDWFLKVLSRS